MSGSAQDGCLRNTESQLVVFLPSILICEKTRTFGKLKEFSVFRIELWICSYVRSFLPTRVIATGFEGHKL